MAVDVSKIKEQIEGVYSKLGKYVVTSFTDDKKKSISKTDDTISGYLEKIQGLMEKIEKSKAVASKAKSTLDTVKNLAGAAGLSGLLTKKTAAKKTTSTKSAAKKTTKTTAKKTTKK